MAVLLKKLLFFITNLQIIKELEGFYLEDV